MVHFTELRVFKEAQLNIQDIAAICECQPWAELLTKSKFRKLSTGSPKIIGLPIRAEGAEATCK